MKIFNFIACLVLFSCMHQEMMSQYGFDTTAVYFDIGKDELSNEARRQLDSISHLINDTPRMMMLYGYADYLGEHSPNQSLSTRRAQQVKAYLMEQKFVPAHLFLQVDGVGQVLKKAKNEHGNQDYRRVDIYIKRLKPVQSIEQIHAKDVQVNSNPEMVGIEALSHLAINETLTLDNILFYPNVSTIIPSSFAQLNDLYDYLKKYSTVKIQLEGHICCTDPHLTSGPVFEQHLELSTNRARRVYSYLIEKGIDASRLSYKGFASTRPKVYPEKTEADQQLNRRVEVRLLAK